MTQPSTAPGSDSSKTASPDRLDSWKEIAAYLKREVRTVQRWEKAEGLPVRRHQHDKLSSVFAYRSELESWWHERQQVLEKEPEPVEEVERAILPDAAAQELPQKPAEQAPEHKLSRSAAATLAVVVVLVLSLGLAYALQKYRSSAPLISAKTRLVVLPFRNLNGDPGQEVFCEGLTESM